MTVEWTILDLLARRAGGLAHGSEKGDQNDGLKQHGHGDRGDKDQLNGLVSVFCIVMTSRHGNLADVRQNR